jgi:DNA-damage-inducible protein D
MTDFSLSLQGTVSPFDSIRRIDEHGKEYWLARDLMPLLGYEKWERVPDVIERAMSACQNTGNVVNLSIYT